MGSDWIGYWFHASKYLGQPFKGTYERDKAGERVFVLVKAEGKRRITFESWQAAKKLGWSIRRG